jgi:hypothetical protein
MAKIINILIPDKNELKTKAGSTKNGRNETMEGLEKLKIIVLLVSATNQLEKNHF